MSCSTARSLKWLNVVWHFVSHVKGVLWARMVSGRRTSAPLGVCRSMVKNLGSVDSKDTCPPPPSPSLSKAIFSHLLFLYTYPSQRTKPVLTPIKTAHFGFFGIFPKRGKVNILWFIDAFFRFIGV